MLELLNWVSSGKTEFDGDNVNKIILSKHDAGKRVLEILGVPHIFVNNEFTILEKDEAQTFYKIFGLGGSNFIEQFQKSENEDVLEIINSVSNIKLRDKSGTFIGARMGRPEKAKVRKMDGEPHTLFPIGKEIGRASCRERV